MGSWKSFGMTSSFEQQGLRSERAKRRVRWDATTPMVERPRRPYSTVCQSRAEIANLAEEQVFVKGGADSRLPMS